MAQTRPLSPFSQHYLEIQALEPAASQAAGEPLATMKSSLGWPILLLGAFVLALGGYLWYAHKRDLKSLMTSMVGVLLITSMSLGLKNINTSQSGEIKASVENIPKEVVIDRLDERAFAVQWRTARETSGAVKVLAQTDTSGLSRVFADSKLNKEHRVVITGLNPGETYMMWVLSESVWYDHDGKPIELVWREKE